MSKAMSDATTRFSARVAEYVKYRPGYPAAVASLLEREAKLMQDSVIVDIGSGTGLSSRLFLERGYRVSGVEPNREMREAGAALLTEFPRFTTIDGRAEATGLPDASADLIIAGQAFHWFDTAATRTECRRILKFGGTVALIWNEWKIDSPFMRDLDAIVERYQYESGRQIRDASRERIREFFAPGKPERADFPNGQDLDFDGLRGRIFSSSYLPKQGDPTGPAMLQEARSVFDRHAINGRIWWDYETEVWWGKFNPNLRKS